MPPGRQPVQGIKKSKGSFIGEQWGEKNNMEYHHTGFIKARGEKREGDINKNKST